MEMWCPSCGQEFWVLPLNGDWKIDGKGKDKGKSLAIPDATTSSAGRSPRGPSSSPRGERHSHGQRSRSRRSRREASSMEARSMAVVVPPSALSAHAWRTIENAVAKMELLKDPIKNKDITHTHARLPPTYNNFITIARTPATGMRS